MSHTILYIIKTGSLVKLGKGLHGHVHVDLYTLINHKCLISSDIVHDVFCWLKSMQVYVIRRVSFL